MFAVLMLYPSLDAPPYEMNAQSTYSRTFMQTWNPTFHSQVAVNLETWRSRTCSSKPKNHPDKGMNLQEGIMQVSKSLAALDFSCSLLLTEHERIYSYQVGHFIQPSQKTQPFH